MRPSDSDEEFSKSADDAYFRQLKRFRREALHVAICGCLSAVAVGIGVVMAFAFEKELAYSYVTECTNLGDLRTDEYDPAISEALGTNDCVRYRNDVVMFDGLLKSKDNPSLRFYYSPVTKMVIRTTRPLPAKPDPTTMGAIPLTPWDLNMVLQKKAFAWDLTVSFDGEGRVMSYDDLPSYLVQVADFFSAQSDVPEEQVRIIMEGEVPEKYIGYRWRLFGAAGLMVATLAIFFFMLRRYVREKRAFDAAVLTVREDPRSE